MKYSLGDREWKSFFISGDEGVFNIKATSSGIDKNKLNLDGVEEIPYITRTDVNNGINFFIPKNQSEKYGMNHGNVITIGLDTQTVFYQPSKFYTGQNIQVLSGNVLNKRISLFIIALLKIQLKKFNWGGNGATLGRLSRTKILLPVDSYGNPDYKFMEDFIKEREKNKREKYRKYVENIINTLGENGDFRERELLNKKWGEFKVKDIFSIIEKCKCNNASQFFDGNIPYVGATNKNNGVMRFIEADKKFITKGNCVCFVCDGQGSVGYSIYKKEDFVGSTTLKVGRFEFINEFISQFLISALDKNRFIYSFGYKRTEERLKNEKILLPITENEEIDYKFMENYMKHLMLRKYQKYLDYIG